MVLDRYGRSRSSTNLSRSRSLSAYTVQRSYSSTDVSGLTEDVIDFCRPWYSKKHTGTSDDIWFYKMFCYPRSSNYSYYRPHRERPYNYWSTIDALNYRKPYYSSYSLYPNRWWLTPSYFESKYYDYNYRPYNWMPYSWYYPKRYHYDLYY